MRTVKYDLPRVAVANSYVDSLIQSTLEGNKEDTIVLINGRECVVTTKFFVDYFRSELKRFPQVKKIIVSQGPDALQEIISDSNTYTTHEFHAMVDTIKKNIETNIDSIGPYVSVTHEIKDIELFALALLERGFRLGTTQEANQ